MTILVWIAIKFLADFNQYNTHGAGHQFMVFMNIGA